MKTYAEAVQFLYDLRLFGAKLGLENTRKLAGLAGRPQDRLRFIHVAGTNGKGSVCAMLERIYRHAGLRVGLYTSPHLNSFCERIQINRKPISETEVIRLVEYFETRLKKLAPARPTFFEVTTVMAMHYFAGQNCDLVLWETGLGGRLDATNIVTPMASVITNVQRDHEQWLGNSIAEIAGEKAGIIKPGVPVITGCESDEALGIIRKRARELKCPFRVAAGGTGIQTSLKGEHQRKNAMIATATVDSLQSVIRVSETAIQDGLNNVHWPGRLQLIRNSRGNETLVDGAHNADGMISLVRFLQREHPEKRFPFVIGVLAEKRWREMFSIFTPIAEQVFLVAVSSERTADPVQLRDQCLQMSPEIPVAVCGSLNEALTQTGMKEFRVISGSLHFIGEVLERLTTGKEGHSLERGLNDWSALKTP